jgi:hypothetical protein
MSCSCASEKKPEAADGRGAAETEFWDPRPGCRQERHHCADTVFAKGERCTWCGLGEDGSYD